MINNKLLVNVRARFTWVGPPKDDAEEAMRKQADILAMDAANKLELVVQLLVLELLNNKD